MGKLENAEKTLAFQMFGKRLKDLTAEERKEYLRRKKAESRANNPHRHEQELEYAKQYRENNREKLRLDSARRRKTHPEDCRKHQKTYRDRLRGCLPYENKLTYQLAGKHIKDMTPEEQKAYNHQRYLLRKQKKENENEKIRNS